jgi:hypothetical protein
MSIPAFNRLLGAPPQISRFCIAFSDDLSQLLSPHSDALYISGAPSDSTLDGRLRNSHCLSRHRPKIKWGRDNIILI